MGAQWPPRRLLGGGRVLVCEPLMTGSFFGLSFFSPFFKFKRRNCDKALSPMSTPVPFPSAFMLHHFRHHKISLVSYKLITSGLYYTELSDRLREILNRLIELFISAQASFLCSGESFGRGSSFPELVQQGRASHLSGASLSYNPNWMTSNIAGKIHKPSESFFQGHFSFSAGRRR